MNAIPVGAIIPRIVATLSLSCALATAAFAQPMPVPPYIGEYALPYPSLPWLKFGSSGDYVYTISASGASWTNTSQFTGFLATPMSFDPMVGGSFPLPAGAKPTDIITLPGIPSSDPGGYQRLVVISDATNGVLYVFRMNPGGPTLIITKALIPWTKGKGGDMTSWNDYIDPTDPYHGIAITTDGGVRHIKYTELYVETPPLSRPDSTPKAAAGGGTLFSLPTPAGAARPPSPQNVVRGGDGSLWFTETFPGDASGNPIVITQEKIGRVSPAGVVTEYLVPSPNALTGSSDHTTGTYIVAGADGNVWFTERGPGKVAKITPAGAITEYPLGVGATIMGLTAGPDGNIWVKVYNGKIVRVTPTGATTVYTIPTTSFGRDVALITGSDGALWFHEDSALGRITMAGVITEFPLPTPTVGGQPNYPFQLVFPVSGVGTFIEYSSGKLGVLQVPTPATGTVAVVEFYNRGLDHYFISSAGAEIADLDIGVHPGWVRTGLAFNAFPPGHAAASPVCRFYIPPVYGDSHFFGRGSDECSSTAAKNPGFAYESPEVMDTVLPGAGTCPSGTVPIYRVFSKRADANHRYTVSRTVRDQMVAKGWLAEGDGPDVVVMCAPN